MIDAPDAVLADPMLTDAVPEEMLDSDVDDPLTVRLPVVVHDG
jgi:hypothetical protein